MSKYPFQCVFSGCRILGLWVGSLGRLRNWKSLHSTCLVAITKHWLTMLTTLIWYICIYASRHTKQWVHKKTRSIRLILRAIGFFDQFCVIMLSHLHLSRWRYIDVDFDTSKVGDLLCMKSRFSISCNFQGNVQGNYWSSVTPVIFIIQGAELYLIHTLSSLFNKRCSGFRLLGIQKSCCRTPLQAFYGHHNSKDFF